MTLSIQARKLIELLGDKLVAKEIADEIDSGSNSDVQADIEDIQADIADIQDTVDSNYPQTATVTLTATQLRKLNATPVTLVAAPGASLALVPVRIIAKYVAGAVAFDAVGAGDDLTIKYTNSSGTILSHFETTGFLDQLSNQIRVALPGNATVALKEFTPVANAPLVAHVLAGEIAAADLNANGDGTLRLEVQYVTVAV